MKNYAQILVDLRAKYNWSQGDLAQQIGVTQQAVSAIEAGGGANKKTAAMIDLFLRGISDEYRVAANTEKRPHAENIKQLYRNRKAYTGGRMDGFNYLGVYDNIRWFCKLYETPLDEFVRRLDLGDDFIEGMNADEVLDGDVAQWIADFLGVKRWDLGEEKFREIVRQHYVPFNKFVCGYTNANAGAPLQTLDNKLPSKETDDKKDSGANYKLLAG